MSKYDGWAMLVADWSVRADKRVVYQVDIDSGTIMRRQSPEAAGWTLQSLCSDAHALLGRSSTAKHCLIAIDVAIGLPRGLLAAWLQHAGVDDARASLATFLRNPPQGVDWMQDSANADQWSWERPYIRVPRGSGSLAAFRDRAQECDITLTRAVDEFTQGKSPLILSGIPGTVGSGSRDVLRELWSRNGQEGWQQRIAVWPFDGSLDDCTSDPKTVVLGEIYPRALYGHVLDDGGPAERRRMTVAKTNRQVRDSAVRLLRTLNWHTRDRLSFQLSEECLSNAVNNEDDFDAYFSALGLLRLAAEGASLEADDLGQWEERPLVDRFAEGGMLGLLPDQVWNDQSRFSAIAYGRGGGAELPNPAGIAAVPPNAPTVWVTEAMLIRATQAIVFHGLPAGTKNNCRTVLLQTDNGMQYRLIIGDTHMIWRSHQETPEQIGSFDLLFEILAEAPGERIFVHLLEHS